MQRKSDSMIKRIIGDKSFYKTKSLRRALKNPRFLGKYMFSNMMGRPELAEIGKFYGTNKVNPNLTFNHLTYLDIYEKYFHPLRDQEISLLEIGVRHGESMRTWKAYFKRGLIHGMDVDPACKDHEEERIQIEIGSQDDVEFLGQAFKHTPQFDIIIDDGSHINSFTIASFEYLFDQRLKSGGFYVIEDLRCSYKKLQTEFNIRETWSGMEHNDPSKNYDNDRQDMDRFFFDKIKKLDFFEGNIQTLHFWPMCCVILKT